MRGRTYLLFALASILIVATGQTQGKPQESKKTEPKKDTRVEPTSWGHVYGRVYDAKTGMPIKDAAIRGCTDNGFEPKGKSTGTTDALGGYHIQLILGRVSHNFDIGRALLSSPLGMLFGTATNTTKRIDVSRVALAVEAPGYKPYQGVVSAKSTDAGKMRIDVQPILLSPSSDSGASVAAQGWNAIRIVRTEVVPPIAAPKEKVQLHVYLRAFSDELAKSTEISAYSDLWKGGRKLKRDKDLGTDGTSRFVGEYQVSGKEKFHAFRVLFAVTKATVDFDPQKSSRLVLVQSAAVGDDRKPAEARLAGIASIIDQRYASARDTFAGLVRSGSKEPFDWSMATALNLRIGDAAAAVEPAANLWNAYPKDMEAAAAYVEALYGAGQDSEVISVSEGIMKGVKDKNLGKTISPDTLGFLGLSYVRTGDLKSADRINETLLKVDGSGLSTEVIEFRGKLRLAEVEKANAADPRSPTALAEYGRALLDLGRFEEAVAKLAESAQLDPSQNSVQRDLAWAALQMKGGKKPVVDLEKAVAEAKNLLGLEKGQQRSKDFYTWDQYGILVFALSEQKREANSTDAPAVRDQAIDALREALTLGRKGAKRNSGYFSGYRFGYMSGSEVAISGFAYPQANSTFVLLDALRKLRKDEADPIALLNASTALLDLGQGSLAQTYTNRLLSVDPNSVEGHFVEGLVKIRQDDAEGAVASLRQVVQTAPNHPRANLVLADVLTEQGDAVGAAERLAAHAAFYGEVDRK